MIDRLRPFNYDHYSTVKLADKTTDVQVRFKSIDIPSGFRNVEDVNLSFKVIA